MYQEPLRKNQTRDAKKWKEGDLKSANLAKRVDRNDFENQRKARELKLGKGKGSGEDDTMHIDDQTGPSMDTTNPVYDPADPYALIRID